MADTQKKFDDIIRKIALVVKLVNEEVDDEPIESEVNELNDEISDLTCDIIDEKNDFVELKDLKNYIIDVIGKNYFADKREISYLYDSVYDVYKDMNNILEEELQTGLGMAQQLPTNSVYDGELDDLYNSDDNGEKNKMKKITKDDLEDLFIIFVNPKTNAQFRGEADYDGVHVTFVPSSSVGKTKITDGHYYDYYDIKDMGFEIKGSLKNKKIPSEITSIFESKEKKKMNKRLEEKKIDVEDRIEALAQFLGLDEEEKEDIEVDDETLTYGREEYLVLTDSEADDWFERYQKELWDDIGIQSFSESFQDWIINNALDKSWFEDAMDESNRFYCEDIADERSREFDNRLVEECYERGLIDDDDFEEDEDGDVDHEQCKKDNDDLIELMVEDMNNDYDDPVEWYKSNFGEESLSEVAIEKNLVDLDTVIEELKSLDGRGATLNSYDGTENEEKVNGEWFYIYRTN